MASVPMVTVTIEGDGSDEPTYDEDLGMLEQMLLLPDMSLVSALGKVSTQQQELGESLVCIFECHGHAMDLVEWATMREVFRNETCATLFRGNAVESRIVAEFAKLGGYDYLRRMLKPGIAKMFVEGKCYEVNPAKVTGGLSAKKAAANMANLLEATEGILSRILSSVSECPSGLQRFFMLLRSLVHSKFPDREQDLRAVSGFFFLRFCCPAIVHPARFALCAEPGASVARGLTLAAKLIQNMANNKELKEEWLMNANVYVVEGSARIRTFSQRLTTADAAPGTPIVLERVCGVPISGLERRRAARSIHSVIHKHWPDVHVLLADEAELVTDLDALVQRIPPKFSPPNLLENVLAKKRQLLGGDSQANTSAGTKKRSSFSTLLGRASSEKSLPKNADEVDGKRRRTLSKGMRMLRSLSNESKGVGLSDSHEDDLEFRPIRKIPPDPSLVVHPGEPPALTSAKVFREYNQAKLAYETYLNKAALRDEIIGEHVVRCSCHGHPEHCTIGAPKRVRTLPERPEQEPSKPAFAPSDASPEAYKEFMRIRLAYETFQNKLLVYQRVCKMHQECGCECKGGELPCSLPLPLVTP